MKFTALVGNCTKCGAPIYDEAEVSPELFSAAAQIIIDFKMKPKTTCECVKLKPGINL